LHTNRFAVRTNRLPVFPRHFAMISHHPAVIARRCA
jgi:hypothetical protein